MSTYADQSIPTAELRHGDNDTVTIAVTFRWRRPWALDKCEAGVLVGDLTRTIVEKYAGWDQLAALESVLTWDPDEQLLIGQFSTSRPILFPSGEPELTERDKELIHARADLAACIHTATYAAHAGDYGSLPMLAEAARGIAAALQAICPHRDGDSFEWTAMERRLELIDAIRRSYRTQVWSADSLNAACASALRITAGWDNKRQEYAACERSNVDAPTPRHDRHGGWT